MDINALLNLEDESHVSTETSDKEIYHAVMDIDDDSPVEPHPTRREVLKALSTIAVYRQVS